MTRPADWAPLAAADPVPGDPARLLAAARRHDDLAAELAQQAAVLQRLAAADGWDADAGRAFASTAREIGTQLDTARRRYSAVGEALRAYAPRLDQAQREADAALREAQAAQNTIDGAEALRRARTRMENAIRFKEGEARRAAAHIRAAVGDDGLKDSWWDKVKDWTSDRWDSFIDWVHENAKVIKLITEIASWIATGIAVVAIALSFIPVVNVVAGPLLLVAAGFTLISLIGNTMLALSGDGSWLDVGIDVIGLVTFGYGKVASKGIKASQQALKTQATRAARKDAAKVARQATRSAVPRGAAAGSRSTKAAATARRSAIRKAARRGAKRAVQENLQNARPTFKKAALTMDGGASTTLAQADALAAIAGPKGAAAHKAITSAAFKTAGAGAIGLGSDALSKVGVLDPVKPWLTFGRYASS
jgi:hypothetical protein